MNKWMLWISFPLLCMCSGGASVGQVSTGQQEYDAYWQQLDDLFRGTNSPLLPEAREHFDSIARYPFAEAYRVTARYLPSTEKTVIKVATTTEAVRDMQVTGHLEFELRGQPQRLPLYRDLSMGSSRMAKVASYFLPFTDLSNGDTTYGGGRYLELSPGQVQGDTVTIDFNLAYNPYCVYNPKYSCPVPPLENHVDVAVEAGARVEFSY